MMARLTLAVAVVMAVVTATSIPAAAQSRHDMKGMVLTVDIRANTVVISHDAVPDVMPAMTMPFVVQEARELNGLVPGAIVSFNLIIEKDRSHIEQLRVVRYESVEQDPLTARRLRLLQEMMRASAKAVDIGREVPDFSLTDQRHMRVSLSQFKGKVVAINFVYTNCALPEFCYRVANHFAVVAKRFNDRMGRDLVLLTVTFDPARDTPERLAEYAAQWNANASVWHLLTGTVADVRRVCGLFGVDSFADEGLINHSSRTAVIDRRGVIAASIEGNRYTAAQLGDLVETVLAR
jgi:protein SCO1